MSTSKANPTSRGRVAVWVAAIAALVASSLVVAGPAAASAPDTWPDLYPYPSPSFSTLAGYTLTSDEPTVYFTSVDATGTDPLLDYLFEGKFVDESTNAVVAEDTVSATREPGASVYSDGEWALSSGDLDVGETYLFSARVKTASDAGPWSEPVRMHVADTAPAPSLTAPANHAVTAASPTLTAAVDDFDSAVGADVAFRVESNWEAGAPIEVDSGWASANSSGVATFVPTLGLSSYEEGHFRWQALEQNDGVSEWSSFRDFYVSQLPYAPWLPTAYQSQHALTLQWGGAGYLEHAPVTGYTATITPGGQSVSVAGDVRSLQFPGLDFGTYSIELHATNVLGNGPSSTISATVGHYGASIPENVTSTVDGTDASVSWSAPSDDGGSPIDHYNYWNNAWCDPAAEGDHTTTSDSVDYSNLVPGCQYQFLVRAVSAAGNGELGVTFFTAYSAPEAPTNPSVQIGDGFANVFWDPPSSDNGRPVTQYRVTVSPGGHQETIDAGDGRQGAEIDGLTNGTAYTFDIEAFNIAGAGPSITSPSVTPMSGATDSDGDGLVDAAEARVGTNPLIDDSDNDGLTDYQEVVGLSGFTDPLNPDTDGDSVDDGAADNDGDGISNAQEFVDGTSPVAEDTDLDGVSDSAEASGGSNPTQADSDGDTLLDGYEIQVGLNPTSADSNSDGTNDADQEATATFTASVPDEDPSQFPVDPPVATIDGAYAALQGTTVEESSASDVPGALTTAATVFSAQSEEADPPAARGLVASSVTASSVDSPTVGALTFHYSSWVEGRLANLAPVVWNDTLGTWEFADNDVSVSTANHTITIDSPALGLRYAVVDLDEWRAHANQCEAAANGHPALDVEVIMDQTSSVADNDPTGERYTAIETVLNSLQPGDRVSVRTFGFLGIILSRGGGHAGGRMAMDPGDANTYAPVFQEASFAPTLTSVDEARANVADIASADQTYFDESDVSWMGSLDNWSEQLLGGTDGSTVYGDGVNGGPECRLHTVVLVTDGQMEPPATTSEEDYVPFRERETPVHVLDVGAGDPSNSDWLEELAADSGGTYSYVPTATDLDGWIDDVTPYDYTPPVADTVDSDGDGLPDNVETAGVVTTMFKAGPNRPSRFTSDPHKVDTDSDGVPDGLEMGTAATLSQLGLTASSTRLGYFAVSNPRSSDSDNDDVSDMDELDMGMNALNPDPDGDLVNDGEELTWGTEDISRDSDGDGWGDWFEIDSIDNGFDPTVFTAQVSETQWLQDWAQGFICGEYCFQDSIGWLIGELMSGYAVFGDIRDITSYANQGDIVSVAWTGVGLLPVLGDLSTSTRQIVRFVTRSSSTLMKQLAVWIGSKYIKRVSDAIDVAEAADHTLVTTLRGMSLSDASIVRLMQSDRAGLLKRVLDSPARRTSTDVASRDPGFIGGANAFEIGKNGERVASYLRGAISSFGDTLPPQLARYVSIGGKLVARYYDVVEESGGVVTKLWESKVGYTDGVRSFKQATKDAAFMADPANAGIQVRWIFFASDRTGRIGPSARLLKYLEDNNIKFEIRFPQ